MFHNSTMRKTPREREREREREKEREGKRQQKRVLLDVLPSLPETFLGQLSALLCLALVGVCCLHPLGNVAVSHTVEPLKPFAQILLDKSLRVCERASEREGVCLS